MATTYAQKVRAQQCGWVLVTSKNRWLCSYAWAANAFGIMQRAQTPSFKGQQMDGKFKLIAFFSLWTCRVVCFFFHNRLISHLQKPSTLSVFAVEKNPCQTNPCLHGGSCLQEGDGYSCYCPQGFSGESCEIGESLPGQQCAGKPRRLAAVGCLVTVS